MLSEIMTASTMCAPIILSAGQHRDDYSHYAWYYTTNIFERHLREINYTVIPYCLDLLYSKLCEVLLHPAFLPPYELQLGLTRYGSEIKTASIV